MFEIIVNKFKRWLLDVHRKSFFKYEFNLKWKSFLNFEKGKFEVDEMFFADREYPYDEKPPENLLVLKSENEYIKVYIENAELLEKLQEILNK